MTYGTYLGKNRFNELTRDLEKGNGQYLAKTSVKEHGDTSRLEATVGTFFGKLYNLALRGGVRGALGDAETPHGKIACSAFIPVLLGTGLCSVAIPMVNAETDADYIGGNITSIGGNMSDESPDPYECLFADDGNLSKIGPALALAAMVAENESKISLRAEKKAAKNVNLGGEHKPPMDVSDFVDADWSEVIEWEGMLYWPNSSMGRAEKDKMYIQELTPLNYEEDWYYRNIYDGPKKPRDNRIFDDDEIAIK